MKAKRKYSYSAREYIAIGWAVLLFATLIAVLLYRQTPGDMPQSAELERVTGAYETLNREKSGKSSVRYDIVLKDGGAHRISAAAGFRRRSF